MALATSEVITVSDSELQILLSQIDNVNIVCENDEVNEQDQEMKDLICNKLGFELEIFNTLKCK